MGIDKPGTQERVAVIDDLRVGVGGAQIRPVSDGEDAAVLDHHPAGAVVLRRVGPRIEGGGVKPQGLPQKKCLHGPDLPLL